MKVFVLPGLDGTGIMLREFAEHLGKDHDVEIVTYPKDCRLAYPDLADLVQVRLPQGVQYAIVAESFSGPVAAIIAARQPHGLVGIVYIASFAAKPSRLPRIATAPAHFVPLKASWLLRLVRPFTFGRWASPRLDGLFAVAMSNVSTDVLAYRLGLVMRANYLIEIGNASVSMLYIRPEQDRLVSQLASVAMASANSRLAIHNIDGPHFILQVRPRECAGVVTQFLEQL